MRINNLIDYCRYYKGEEENPFEGKDQNKAMFWFYERHWVNEISKNENLISEYLSDYLRNDLDNFSFNDHIPITLKALLFNRYNHWNMGGAEGFKEFYLKEYLGEK